MATKDKHGNRFVRTFRRRLIRYLRWKEKTEDNTPLFGEHLKTYSNRSVAKFLARL